MLFSTTVLLIYHQHVTARINFHASKMVTVKITYPQQSAVAAKGNTALIAFALLVLFNVINVMHSIFLRMKWLVQTRD